MASKQLHTKKGRDTPMRRLRRLGLAAMLMAGTIVLVLIVRGTVWFPDRSYIVFLASLGLWFIVLSAYSVQRLYRIVNRAISRAQRIAIVDKASGSFEYLYVEMRLEEEQARINRYGGTTAVLYVDVADLDVVNDRFGPLVVNKVLEGVAGAMRADLRQCDIIGRLGVNEFLGILPETDRRKAHVVAERLLKAIKEHLVGLPELGAADFIRVSVGVAAYPLNGETMENVVTAARNAARSASQQGGNAVLVSEEFIRTDQISQEMIREVRGPDPTNGPGSSG